MRRQMFLRRETALPPDERKGSAFPTKSKMIFRGYAAVRRRSLRQFF
jgi:hypothetical protein